MSDTTPQQNGTSRVNIVLGYIPAPPGLAALERALHYARLEGARLTVVNTGKDGNYADPVFAEERDIDALAQRLTEAGVEHDIRRPDDGRSADESILAIAEEVGADLVVIGVRRRSPVGKLLTGSTAQAVILGAECPVLAVKPRA
jgi:nucleotide-binding universal stress UspA family protein